MALGIPLYILLNAIVSLSKETTVTVSTPITSQQSNWTVNKTEAEYTEGLIALKFSHPCLADHHSYCINGICVFHHELKKAICSWNWCWIAVKSLPCSYLLLCKKEVWIQKECGMDSIVLKFRLQIWQDHS
ncbi:epigen isoform X5 [Petaurus breviceps papuanus]|uniref:epigen isoform X5 n=1 Tax=Petaurus breviceps papuanus TaxID=3040969 RepID=UPI0036D7D598